MYGPPPPRPKKTNITRSRNGCISCRRKKRKCDEGRPSCELCSRLRIPCSYQRPLARFQDAPDKPGRPTKVRNNGELLARLTQTGTPMHSAKDRALSNGGLQPEYQMNGSERIYLSQYFAHIVDFLPTSVRPVVSRMSTLPALCDATVAFSAARFAYSLGIPYHTQSKTLVRPNQYFFIQSLNYFSRAIKLIQKNYNQLEDVLATVIFFILFEHVVGTVRSYSCHLQGLETLTLRYHHALSATPYGQLLLRASLFTLAKGALFLGPLHSLRRESMVHRELDILADRICSPQEILFFMVVDVIRISSSLLLRKSTQYPSDKLQQVLQRMSASGYGNAHLSGSSESEVYEKLASLQRRIDILFAQSTPLFNALVRCTSHPGFHDMEFSYTDDTVPPITFASHEEAMACAMYALVQVYCDKQPLQYSLDAASGPTTSKLNGWAKVILKIAKECDPPRYLYDETYNMNMCWIVGLLCLRWPNTDILTHIAQTVLPDLKSTMATLEDTAGALLLFEMVIEMLCSESARGRKVFAVYVVHEDSSDVNAFLLVNRSLHFSIHGYSEDGSFFSDYIPALR